MSIRPRRTVGLQNIDMQTISCYFGLVGIGWMMIVATTGKGASFTDFSPTAVKQGAFIGLSFILIVAISFIEWKFWRTVSYVVYALTILSLIAVLFFGKKLVGQLRGSA